jgi:hypothetical protein
MTTLDRRSSASVLILLIALTMLTAALLFRRGSTVSTTVPLPTATPTLVLPDGISGMPFYLNCNWIDRAESGPTWRGLTIGITMENEFLSKFSSPPRHDTEYGFLGYNASSIQDKGVWYEFGTVSACFIDGILAALQVDEVASQGPELITLPLTVGEWVEEFGEPNQVTWAWGHDNVLVQQRTLIWAEKGYLISAETCPGAHVCDFYYGSERMYDGSQRMNTSILGNFVSTTILFSPLPDAELEDSLIFASLPVNPPPHDPELPGASQVKDPWGFTSR